jgi:hypothetical protein
LLGLTKQGLDGYSIATYGQQGMRCSMYGFTSDKDRTAAIAKFKKWWDENKNKPEYKDLKPLDLPKAPERR